LSGYQNHRILIVAFQIENQGINLNVMPITLRVCLVGMKIIFMKNNFFILRCLAKKEKENYFKGKMIFPI